MNLPSIKHSGSLFELPVILIDCQTTSGSSKNGRILELAWWSGSIASGFTESPESYLFSIPIEEIPSRVLNMTRLKSDDFTRSRKSEWIWNRFESSLSPHLQSVIHYSRFELSFLRDHWPAYSKYAQNFDVTLCTHEIFKRLHPGHPHHGLRGVAGYYGSPLTAPQRAKDYVHATRLVWSGLCQELHTMRIRSLSELTDWLQNTSATPSRRGKLDFLVDHQVRLDLPDSPGVYFFKNQNQDILYVGKAKSLKSRVNSYFRSRHRGNSRIRELLSQVRDIDFVQTPTALTSALLESQKIKEHCPPFNRALVSEGRCASYYDRSFQDCSPERSRNYFIGPVPGRDAFLALGWFADFMVKPVGHSGWPYLLDVSEATWLDAHSLFFEKWRKAHLKSRRDWLALGLRIYRAQKRLELREDQEEIDHSDQSEKDSVEPREWTAEELLDHLERSLAHCARFLWRARIFRRLQNASVNYLEPGSDVWHQVQCQPSQISWQETALPLQTPLEEYDSFRILWTELQRIVKDGGRIELHFDIPGSETQDIREGATPPT